MYCYVGSNKQNSRFENRMVGNSKCISSTAFGNTITHTFHICHRYSFFVVKSLTLYKYNDPSLIYHTKCVPLE